MKVADPQKTPEAFDFAACTKLPQKEIADLATCRFIERHENLFFVGPAGPPVWVRATSPKRSATRPAGAATT